MQSIPFLFVTFCIQIFCYSHGIGAHYRTRADVTYPKSRRIAGGVTIDIENFPHQAQLVQDNVPYCGGVVVSDRVILTAAHCVFNEGVLSSPADIDVILGSSYSMKGTKYKACFLYPHPKFDETHENYYFYDIALVLLTRKIQFGRRVAKAKIVPNNKWRNEKYTMSITGFGFVQTEGHFAKKLKMTRMKYINRATCSASQTADGSIMPVPKHMFCLKSEQWTSDCYGDSGSGVMWKDYLVGLVASGRDTACGSESMPSMYTDVFYFKDWIKEGIKQLESRKLKTCEVVKKVPKRNPLRRYTNENDLIPSQIMDMIDFFITFVLVGGF